MKVKIKATGKVVEVSGPASTNVSEGIMGGWRLKNDKVIPYDDCIILQSEKEIIEKETTGLDRSMGGYQPNEDVDVNNPPQGNKKDEIPYNMWEIPFEADIPHSDMRLISKFIGKWYVSKERILKESQSMVLKYRRLGVEIGKCKDKDMRGNMEHTHSKLGIFIGYALGDKLWSKMKDKWRPKD